MAQQQQSVEMKGKVASILQLTPDEMRTMIQGIGKPEFAQEISDVFFMNVESSVWDSVNAIRKAVAYKAVKAPTQKFMQRTAASTAPVTPSTTGQSLGFDPRKIIQVFLNRSKVNAAGQDATATEHSTASGMKFRLYENNHAATDLLFFITLFLEHGNSITRIMLKCDETLVFHIRRKVASYGIITDQKQRATILGTSSLTLARLAQAFPLATAVIIIKNKIPGKLKTKALVGVTDMPVIMQHKIFPSLIPQQDEDMLNDLRSIAIVLNIERSILLTTPKKKRKLETKDVDELTAKSEQYVDAAMTASTYCFLEDDVKIQILKKAQVIDAAGHLTLIPKLMASQARRFLAMGTRTYNEAVKALTQEFMERTAASAPVTPSTTGQSGSQGLAAGRRHSSPN